MAVYHYQNKNIQSYLNGLYAQGLGKSLYLTNEEIEDILGNIGIFKFKGYYYAFKHSHRHTIDDILMVYYFDKYLTRIIMDLTSTIETKLKTVLVELCYKKLSVLPRSDKNKNNPFFYLIKRNYKRLLDSNGNLVLDRQGNPKRFKINGVTEGNWKVLTSTNINVSESYSHYNLYYKNKYDMPLNKTKYLSRETLIITRADINYPPFHYLIESATLGGVIHLIKYLKIASFDILQQVSSHFSIHQSQNFIAYLERLNEVRNRAAHRERIFNRSYRSISRIGQYRSLSASLNEHKFIDVYLYFFFMLDKLDNFDTIEIFKEQEIERLFKNFKEDYSLQLDSKMLIKNIKSEKFEEIKDFIMRGME